jgi:hypothetical protein
VFSLKWKLIIVLAEVLLFRSDNVAFFFFDITVCSSQDFKKRIKLKCCINIYIIRSADSFS